MPDSREGLPFESGIGMFLLYLVVLAYFACEGLCLSFEASQCKSTKVYWTDRLLLLQMSQVCSR